MRRAPEYNMEFHATELIPRPPFSATLILFLRLTHTHTPETVFLSRWHIAYECKLLSLNFRNSGKYQSGVMSLSGGAENYYH